MVKTIEIQGFPHAYELSAPTDSPIVLVFVHGWLLSHAYWQPVIEHLSSTYQCLTYDLRGFGRSQPPVSTSSAALEVGAPAVSPMPTAVAETVAEKTIVGVTPAKTAANLNWRCQPLSWLPQLPSTHLLPTPKT
ncbi:MAG: alpha/beta fold hydrolase [Cyanobacteria bacterium RM1_2_2]|nr:alpha/beta fold hydrolase [Cyanobacteria bacterium RM1_2_2]